MRLLPRVQAGLDWWLASPHRAFLTWIACSYAIWRVAWGYEMVTRLFVADTFQLLQAHIPFPLPFALWHAGAWGFFFASFQPILLRVGFRRTLLWWCAAVIAFFVANNVGIPWRDFDRLATKMGYEILVSGLPALAMLGKRTRPWMAIIASAISGLTLTLAAHIDQPLREALLASSDGPGVSEFFPQRLANVLLAGSDYWSPFVGYILAGAVLIYGTKPLPPRERAVASEPTGASDAPAP